MDEKPERKIAHLQLIDGHIGITSGWCLAVKGWCAAFVSAFLALGVKHFSSALTALCVVLLFGLVDSVTFRHEKKYKALYVHVRGRSESDIDFSLEFLPSTLSESIKAWIKGSFSLRVFGFYLGMGVAIVLSTLFQFQPIWDTTLQKVKEIQ